jgi:hypothetical protein
LTTPQTAARDTLFLLDVSFDDANAGPGPFYCPDSTAVYGVILSFPQLAGRLDIRRIGFARPRQQIVDLIGAPNQSCPVLILPEGETSQFQTGVHDGRAYVSDLRSIRIALMERHGFPAPHP